MDHSFAYSKAAINNFMNSSHHNEESPNKGDIPSSKERKKRRKSNSKINTLGGTKNSVLKELLQMKQENKDFIGMHPILLELFFYS
jgi:hypothetical protein